jgi:hypothetical protein
LKNTLKDPNSLWGIQIENSGDAYGSSGLNFWRPSGSDESSGNKYIFLKNTGTTWVGFQSQNIFDDVIDYTSQAGGIYRGTYTLYVSDGILVKGVPRQINQDPPTPSLAIGAPTDGSGLNNARAYQRLKLGDDMTDGSISLLSVMSNNSQLQIHGSASNTISVVDNNFNFYMLPYNGGTFGALYHPFKIIRYSFFWGDNIVDNKTLVDNDGVSTIPSTDWAAMVVGFNYDNDNDQYVNNFIVACFRDSGVWKLRVGNDGGSGSPNQIWNVDVLFIRKGWYDDTARTGFGQPGRDIQI